jgi:F420-dependent oxidoreductase-like protein
VQISMQLNYAGGYREAADTVVRFEKAGLDMIWIAEAYGFDGPSLMGYVAATTDTIQIAAGILPIYTRTPTLLAQTAAGIDALSDGRFHMGLGASGPQVIEGWHGVPYDKPLTRTREIVDICRKVWAREERLTYDGKVYHLPLPEDRGTGLGKPLKIINHPLRPSIPIWVASLGPKNVEMTAEVADGWLPLFYVPEKASEVWGDDLARGKAKRDASLGPLQISAGGLLAIGEDAASFAEFARPMAALYIGGMGAKGRNFYNDLVCRYGYEKEAAEIQDLYLDGKKEEAAAKVPAELLELTNLCGPESFVAERIAAYKESGVTNLSIIPLGADPADLIAQVKTLAS